MSQRLLSSNATVQVFSPSLVTDALICTIASYPSGSQLVRTITRADFESNAGDALLNSLSDAVESILQEGIAVAASGTQGVDPSGLLYDAVLFTVRYVPTTPTPGEITSTIEIPVLNITVDTQFGGTFGGIVGIETAPELILAEYNRLKGLAGQ